MKLFLRMLLVLSFISALSGLLLSSASKMTLAQIKENEIKDLENAVYKIIPEGKKYTEKSINAYKVYSVYQGKGLLCAYCILAKGNGYQGEIKMLIAVNSNLKSLRGIEILQNLETPGLGGKIGGDAFKNQFRGLEFLPEIVYLKNKPPKLKNEIEAITGATISSSSVTRIINRTLNEVIPILKKDAR